MHGTVYEEHDGRLVRVIDHSGAIHAELVWDPDSGRLIRLVVPNAVVEAAIIPHPLLGIVHAVGDTVMSVLDWMRPTEIPVIAEPGRLLPGAGSAILNTISVLARRAGVPALRYAGPYPTSALWRTLLRSFRCDASSASFTANAMDRALRVARDPIAIDFVPAPHERVAITGGFVELRDGIERVVIDDIAYEMTGTVSLLSRSGAGAPERDKRDTVPVTCDIWFGDALYARVATLGPDGSLIDGPHAIPPCESPVLGREFPFALRAAIAELVADAVAAPLAADARVLCGELPLRWADLGGRAAREDRDGFAVHGALWERIAPRGLGRLALALAEALAPVVAAAVVRRASRAAAERHVTVEAPSGQVKGE